MIMFWFFLYPTVYIEIKKNALVYDTNQNKFYIVKNPVAVAIVSALLDIDNMGSVLISENDVNLRDIQTIVNMGLGMITNSKDINDKPIILPVQEAINEDFDKLFKGNVSEYLLKKDVSKYLLKLSLILNGKIDEYSENKFHDIEDESILNNMPLHIIRDVLCQIKYFPIQNVNLCGEKIYKHPHFNYLIEQILNMNKGVVLSIDIGENFEFDNILENNNNKGIKYEFIISDYSNLSNLREVYELIHNTDCKFIFKIENDFDLNIVGDILSAYVIKNYIIQPIFNFQNTKFITSLLSPNSSDIFSRPIPLKEIYRNKRINSNTFGKLTIDVDGSIYSDFRKDKISDSTNLTIKGCINKELMANSTWRLIRANGRCNKCLLQYICPPPTEIERYLDLSNTCNSFIE